MSDIPALLERFRRGPEVLAVVLTGVFGEEEEFVTAPGNWNIRQIIAHLADTELVFAYRVRKVIAEDSPAIAAFDQNAWALNLGYARRKPKQSLETLRRLRAENHELLKELPPEVFDRTCHHSERGLVTLRELVETYEEHTEDGARQMQEIRDAFKLTKIKK